MKAGVDFQLLDLDQEQSLFFLTGNHRTFLVDRALADRLRGGTGGSAGAGPIEAELTDAERAEWRALAESGLRSSENPRVLGRSAVSDGADLAINVNLTNVCNLACTYCFADGGDYGRMTDAMGHRSIDDIFAFITAQRAPGQGVRLEMFGGEPLANFAVMRDICARSEQYAAEHDVRFVYRISTNLTLLPKGVCELFARHRFIVSVSIDGGRQVQDANRPSKNGRGSYDRVMANVRKVRRASDDITMVARMTVAQHTPSLLENMRQLYDLNIFDYFQIYPGVFPADEPEPTEQPQSMLLQIGTRPPDSEPQSKRGGCGSGSGAAAGTERYVNFFLQDGMVEQFREFLREYPRLFRPDNRFKGVLEYERTAQMLLEGKLALAFCSGGRTYYTHSPDTSITSCHRLVGDQSFDVGTGEQGMTRVPQDWRLPVDRHPVCGQCWARYLCGGGCKQENFVATGDVNVLNEESCRYQLLLAEEVLRLMGTAGEAYHQIDRHQLDDMFVSCGRPVLPNGRARPSAEERRKFVHFRPLQDRIGTPDAARPRQPEQRASSGATA